MKNSRISSNWVTISRNCFWSFLVGFEDDYVLEDIEIGLSDHTMKCLKASFGAAWDSMENETEETFAIPSVNTVPEAVANILAFMGMQASHT